MDNYGIGCMYVSVHFHSAIYLCAQQYCSLLLNCCQTSDFNMLNYMTYGILIHGNRRQVFAKSMTGIIA